LSASKYKERVCEVFLNEGIIMKNRWQGKLKKESNFL